MYQKGKELRTKQEVEKEWNEWNNAKDVLSADEADPLIGLRFKFGKMENLPRAASELILETEWLGWEKKFRRKKRIISTGIPREK